MTLAELNAQQPLDDVYFEYDKSDLSDGRAREPAEERGLDAEVDVDQGDRSKATPTRAARTSTTSRSASAARRRSATTWSSLGMPSSRMTS